MFRKCLPALFVVALALGLTACSQSANSKDQATSAAILSQMETAQPVPVFTWSQIRQTLIDIETAQAKTVQTTTFFFNLGVKTPVNSCPSIGFPVATTDELTNPQQAVGGSGGQTSIAQIDPNGIYAGNSTGTYVLCIGSDGSTFGAYWEGYVYAVTGPAVWNDKTGAVQETGPSSFKFTTSKP